MIASNHNYFGQFFHGNLAPVTPVTPMPPMAPIAPVAHPWIQLFDVGATLQSGEQRRGLLWGDWWSPQIIPTLHNLHICSCQVSLKSHLNPFVKRARYANDIGTITHAKFSQSSVTSKNYNDVGVIAYQNYISDLGSGSEVKQNNIILRNKTVLYLNLNLFIFYVIRVLRYVIFKSYENT